MAYNHPLENFTLPQMFGPRIYMAEDDRLVVEGSSTTPAKNLAEYMSYSEDYHQPGTYTKQEVRAFVNDLKKNYHRSLKGDKPPNNVNSWEEYYSTAQHMYETMAEAAYVVADKRANALRSDVAMENRATGWFTKESWDAHEKQVQDQYKGYLGWQADAAKAKQYYEDYCAKMGNY